MSGWDATPTKLLPRDNNTPQPNFSAEFPGGNDSSGVALIALIINPSLSSRIGLELADMQLPSSTFRPELSDPKALAGPCQDPIRAGRQITRATFRLEKWRPIRGRNNISSNKLQMLVRSNMSVLRAYLRFRSFVVATKTSSTKYDIAEICRICYRNLSAGSSIAV